MKKINVNNIKIRFINTIKGLHLFNNPSKKLKIVGVTGTNGKTTTATLLYKIALALGYKAGLVSTVENLIIGEKRLSPANGPITSPDLVFLNQLLKEMVEKGCEYVFMEVSSHALDQSRVAGINFAGGIFTNLTHDHLDYHKNIENYFGAKKKFFKMLPKNAFALSNVDDEYGVAMTEGIKAKSYFYGFKNKADFSEKLETKLLGSFNEYNTLAVYAAGVLLGWEEKKIRHALKEVVPPRGRFEHFTSPSGVLVVVDYAHSPDALEKILLAVREIRQPAGLPAQAGKIISVFGCGGNKDPFKRPIMGRIGATLSDIAIFTSDNPRNEDPNKIIEQMQEGLSSEDLKKVRTIANRGDAIKEAIKLAQKGDIILCAGKGHEDYQEIKGVKSHFDDMEEFRKAYD